MSVDPQTCTDAELRRRMKRYAKLEPGYLADMMTSEARLYVPKKEIPVPRAGTTTFEAPQGFQFYEPTLADVMEGRQ